MPKFLLILLFIPASLFAQNTVTGKVLSLADKKPIAEVSIFFNNTTIGTKTLPNGSFTLSNIQNGAYKIIVSCVGYETYTQALLINKDIHMADIELIPAVVNLNEVVIKSKHKSHINMYLKIFTSEFLGHSKNAEGCKILNPKLLRFNYDNGNDRLAATTNDFLIIENKSLGYRIKYLLVSFLNDPRWNSVEYKGYYYFQEMDSTAEQKQIWSRRRAETYHGSEMHFLRSCLANRLSEEGFTVWEVVRTPSDIRPPDSVVKQRIKELIDYPNSSEELNKWLRIAKLPSYQQAVLGNKPLEMHNYIRYTDQKGIYAIGNLNTLMVNYHNTTNGSDKNSTFITFVKPDAYFDSNGVLFTPENCVFEGLWGTKRVGELLPDDYKLPTGM